MNRKEKKLKNDVLNCLESLSTIMCQINSGYSLSCTPGKLDEAYEKLREAILKFRDATVTLEKE